MILFSFVSVNILGNLYWENISKNVIDCRLTLVNLSLFNELNQRSYIEGTPSMVRKESPKCHALPWNVQFKNRCPDL